MKKRIRWINAIVICFICFLAICGGAIYVEYTHAPIQKIGSDYIMRDTYNNHVGTISIADAERIYINQSKTYELWQYKDEDIAALLDAVAWRTMAMDTEVAQFAISFSNAEDAYLPQDRAQETHYFSNVNLRTHDYVHLFFYSEVLLGNGEMYQNLLLLMRE